MRAALCALSVLACTGCLHHEVRIAPGGGDSTAGRSAVGSVVRDGGPNEQRRGPLPHEVPVSWTLRDADGALLRADAVVTSPLPWWQRFPADLFVDLWPGDVVVAVSATPTPRLIVARTHADITAEARAHGYAE